MEYDLVRVVCTVRANIGEVLYYISSHCFLDTRRTACFLPVIFLESKRCNKVRGKSLLALLLLEFFFHLREMIGWKKSVWMDFFL